MHRHWSEGLDTRLTEWQNSFTSICRWWGDGSQQGIPYRKPTPCSLVSSSDFPRQKRWNFFPWKILNLAASSHEERQSLFAVAKKAWCQCPDVPSGQFSGRGFLSVALCRVVNLLIGFHPNSTHPVRLTGRGGAASYWQGATQPKAGGSCPMRCDDLSHRPKQPLASCFAQIEQEIYIR